MCYFTNDKFLVIICCTYINYRIINDNTVKFSSEKIVGYLVKGQHSVPSPVLSVSIDVMNYRFVERIECYSVNRYLLLLILLIHSYYCYSKPVNTVSEEFFPFFLFPLIVFDIFKCFLFSFF